MTIKLLLLKSGEQLVSDAKELVSEEKVRGYLLNKPQKVVANKSMFLSEEQSFEDINVEVTFSPWILLTSDEDIVVPTDWVVTVVEPLESVVKMYQDKINGQNN
jgi:hypothetical protein